MKWLIVLLLLTGPAMAAAPSTGTVLPVGWVNGQRYMKCDGTTDDTTGFQNAINDAKAIHGTLILPKGVCNISATVSYSGTVKIVGAGGGASSTSAATTLEWVGASSTTPMIDLQGATDSYFSDFLIEASATHPLGFGIRSITTTGSVSNANVFNHIFMNGTTNAIDVGFAWVSGSGGDANNDEFSFYDCRISNYKTAAWSIGHTQSKLHNFVNSRFYAGTPPGTNQSGVTNPGGGGFSWYGGFGTGNAEADFFLVGAGDPILISGGRFESSNRFVEANFFCNTTWPVSIIDSTFTADALNADHQAIIYTCPGPFTIAGGRIGVDSSVALQITLASKTVGSIIGTHIYSSLADPVVGSPRSWSMLGNTMNDPLSTAVPNTIMSEHAAVTIANLPSCTAATQGQQAVVSNGQTTPAWNGAVSTTGAVYASVGCVQTGSSTYGWVYR